MVQGEAEAGRLAHVLLDGLRDVARSVGLGKAVASEDCNYTREVRVGIMTDVMLWLIVFAVAQGQCRKTRRKPARMGPPKMSDNRYLSDILAQFKRLVEKAWQDVMNLEDRIKILGR